MEREPGIATEEDAAPADGRRTTTPIGIVTLQRIDAPEVLQPLAEDVNRAALEALARSDVETFNRIRSENPGKYPVLVGERLKGKNLPGVDFGYAHLQAADLSGANLAGANFRGALMRLTDLSNADLRGANFAWAILGMANLKNADLTDVRGLSADQMSDSVFRGCKGLPAEFVGELLYRLGQSLNP